MLAKTHLPCGRGINTRVAPTWHGMSMPRIKLTVLVSDGVKYSTNIRIKTLQQALKMSFEE